MAGGTAVQAGTSVWRLDPTHSSVEFAVKHMMMTTVRGRFKSVSATLTGDETHPEACCVEAEMDVASIDTGVADRDVNVVIRGSRTDRNGARIRSDRLGRIDQKVHPDLVELCGICFDRRKFTEITNELDASYAEISRQDTDRRFDAFVNVGPLKFGLVET